MGRQIERELNWQVVSLKVPVEELHDAPILYIAGDQALDFSESDTAKLRQFVEEPPKQVFRKRKGPILREPKGPVFRDEPELPDWLKR